MPEFQTKQRPVEGTTYRMLDGNGAATHVAYRASEIIAIYPITPASPMGELSDSWSANSKPNLWGTVPTVVQLQSEGGAAGAIHGALQAGSLATTFTASQGLLLMLPDMFKIAGELTPTVFHIAARTIATHALSIFGDHSDVMTARSTGFAILFSSSVQEAMDFAAVAHSATLAARVPFIHGFDGFRTSHELQKVAVIPDEVLRQMLPDHLVHQLRARGLSPDRPVIRGTAQNPDVFFQSREASSPYYQAAPGLVQAAFDTLAAATGRGYHLFDYVGHPEAERVVVCMGSGCQTLEETIAYLQAQGQKVGLVKVRLFRPFSGSSLVAALPASTQTIAVLDRTKEPGATAEPLYQDVTCALAQALALGQAPFKTMPRILGGRYGLGSKEFTPAMAKGIFDEMRRSEPRSPFTVGIIDDVSHTSLAWDATFELSQDSAGKRLRGVFWGIGSDGTVGACKNTTQLVGDATDLFAQAYFVYDSKKSGTITASHLRFSKEPINQPYLVSRADFVGISTFDLVGATDTLDVAAPGATVLLASPYGPTDTWQHLVPEAQSQILAKKLQVHVVDADAIARRCGLTGRTGTLMQSCFLALSGLLSKQEALARLEQAVRKAYGKRGEAVVSKNLQAINSALEELRPLAIPATGVDSAHVAAREPAFGADLGNPLWLTAQLIAGKGDQIPVSALPADGTFPVGTAWLEKRNLAAEVPIVDLDLCIQCGKCVMVCPHAVIRSKVCAKPALANAPEGFNFTTARFKDAGDCAYTLQVAVEDCTGCTLCVDVCPSKDKSNPERKALEMAPQRPLREAGRRHWEFFLSLPDHPRAGAAVTTVKDLQLLQPLFEFSGACSGCGETPYLKLLSQLFGDRALIANATGCSSIYGGNLPTTPWSANRAGRGPAWANSLFEDNSEFGLGMRLAVEKQATYARELLDRLGDRLEGVSSEDLLNADVSSAAGIEALRLRISTLKQGLAESADPAMSDLLSVIDALVPRSVWIVGGDGWAYDIGFGGLDHVLAGGRNVNVLVLDTEVYSNTGGQASKATPLGAVARFAEGGKAVAKKDLGRIAMGYPDVYVAQVALGANDSQTLKAFLEAEAHPGPSLILAYSPCIAHGFDLARSLTQQKLAVQCGHWPLYRYDPRLAKLGKPALQLDSKPPSVQFEEYAKGEGRYQDLVRRAPERAAQLMQAAQESIYQRWAQYEHLARFATETRVPVGDTKPPVPAM